jgi:hypothetical protein
MQIENSENFEGEIPNKSVISFKDSTVKRTEINVGIFPSDNKNKISEFDQSTFPSQFHPSNVISFSPIRADFSPYVAISSVGTFTSQNKIAVTQIKSRKTENKIISNEKIKFSNSKEILEELNELKQKYKRLESQIKKINETKFKKTKEIKKANKPSPNKIKKNQKRSPSEEDKINLLNKIIALSVEDKKSMRGIIKDYITIRKDETFTFNLADLPRDVYHKLNKFVLKCVDESSKKELKVQLSTKESTEISLEKKKIFKEVKLINFNIRILIQSQPWTQILIQSLKV